MDMLGTPIKFNVDNLTNDEEFMKSTFGFAFMLGGGTISWQSQH